MSIYFGIAFLVILQFFDVEVKGQSILPPQLLLQLLRGLPRDPPMCSFQCPPGLAAVTREGHVPRYNGCGSYGIERLILPQIQIFRECCNAHDICYDTCGQSKQECDGVLQACLLQRCNSIIRSYNNYRQMGQNPPAIVANCMSTAQLLSQGPAHAGCNPYMIAQMNACDCQSPSPAPSTNSIY